MGLLLYPFFLVVFWYKDFFLGCFARSIEIFIYAAELLSVPLLLKTFFAPIKNEYHEGLVLFSVIMGIIVKSVILTVDSILLFILFVILFALNVLVLVLPVLIVRMLLL